MGRECIRITSAAVVYTKDVKVIDLSQHYAICSETDCFRRNIFVLEGIFSMECRL